MLWASLQWGASRPSQSQRPAEKRSREQSSSATLLWSGGAQVCADSTWGAPLRTSQNRLISDSGDSTGDLPSPMAMRGTQFTEGPVKRRGKVSFLSHHRLRYPYLSPSDIGIHDLRLLNYNLN